MAEADVMSPPRFRDSDDVARRRVRISPVPVIVRGPPARAPAADTPPPAAENEHIVASGAPEQPLQWLQWLLHGAGWPLWPLASPAAHRAPGAQKLATPAVLRLPVPLGERCRVLLRTIVFSASFLLSAIVIVAGLCVPWALYRVIPPLRHAYLVWAHALLRLFGSVIVLLTTAFAPVTIHHYGAWTELEERSRAATELAQKAVIMANHQMYADWWYLWIAARQVQRHGDLKIILRGDLKRVPVFGWGMSMIEFIFVARRWLKDGLNLYKMLRRARQDAVPMWLVIFPEGTVITRETLEKSHSYGRKTGLALEPHYTLLPKTTGLHFITRILHGPVTELWDATIGFSGVHPRRTADAWPFDVHSLSSVFLRGRGPRNVHMYWRRYDTRAIPGVSPLSDENATRRVLAAPVSGVSTPAHSREPSASSVASASARNATDATGADAEREARLAAEFGDWLRARFLEKDQLMRYYYRHGVFFDPADATFTDSPVSPVVARGESPLAATPRIPGPATPVQIYKVRATAQDYLAALAILSLMFAEVYIVRLLARVLL